MDNPAIVAAWAAAIAAIVGPIISVAMAHMMIRYDERRRVRIDLVNRLIQQIIEFENVIMRYSTVRSEATEALNNKDQSLHSDLVRQAQNHLYELKMSSAILRATLISIEFQFGARGKNCTECVSRLIDQGTDRISLGRNDYDEAGEAIGKLVGDALTSINHLLSAIPQTDEFDA